MYGSKPRHAFLSRERTLVAVLTRFPAHHPPTAVRTILALFCSLPSTNPPPPDTVCGAVH